jgi:hypothetical protein
MSRLIRIGWQHPHRGRIEETACPRHDAEVMAALRTLGIGCSGTYAEPDAACDRCRHEGQRFRAWINEVTAR